MRTSAAESAIARFPFWTSVYVQPAANLLARLFQGVRCSATSGYNSRGAECYCRDDRKRGTWMQCGARIHAALARMPFPVSASLSSVCRHRIVEVVRAAIDRLVRSLRIERPPLHIEVSQTWCEPGGAQLCSGPSRDQFPERVLCSMQDHLRHHLRRIDGRHGLWLHVEVGPSLFKERRVDACGFDQRDGDGESLFLDLHSQGIGERLERVFRRTVAAL